jgi:hypothetical protein
MRSSIPQGNNFSMTEGVTLLFAGVLPAANYLTGFI